MSSKYAFASYQLARTYPSMASQNTESWRKVKSLSQVNKRGPMSMDDLVTAIGDHDAPGGARGFVLYCCKSGWLRGA
jgi:hypothetical protein